MLGKSHRQNIKKLFIYLAIPKIGSRPAKRSRTSPQNQTGVVFRNATLRQTIRISLGAPVIRLQISNAFGGSDLPITAVTVGVTPNNTAGIAGIQGDLHKVTFSGGQAGFTVPVGALVVSDPIELPLKALDVLSVSIYLERGQTTNSITGHPGSRTTSWFAPGNAVEAKDFTGQGIDNTDHWYFISRVEGWAPTSGGSPGALVIVGDSITDGRGSTHNQNNRYETPCLIFMPKVYTTTKRLVH